MGLDICAIIVTFNRKELLYRCINAIFHQSFKVSSLYIIDNASTDKTYEYLREKGLFVGDIIDEEIKNTMYVEKNIVLNYYRMKNNKGGAGGFSKGLQIAHQKKIHDAFWLMDDDGYPSNDCLKNLENYLASYHYVMPVSINIDNHNELSWPTITKNKLKTIKYSELKASWGEIMDYVYPFNGVLLSNKIVDSVGYINPDLFIWGDEYEHYWRCKSHGFNPITITTAQFYHPANKMNFVPILFGLVKVPFSESKLRMVCLARNYTYIYWNYKQRHKILLKFAAYSWLYIFTRKFDMDGYKLYIQSVIDGLRKRFDRHKQFLNR